MDSLKAWFEIIRIAGISQGVKPQLILKSFVEGAFLVTFDVNNFKKVLRRAGCAN